MNALKSSNFFYGVKVVEIPASDLFYVNIYVLT